MALRNLAQGLVDILGHVAGIAADVQLRAFLQPAPQLGALFADAILHVDFLRLIAGKRQAELVEQAIALHALQFFAIVEIAGGVLLTEEQPVATLVPPRAALLQERRETAPRRCRGRS